MSVKHQNSPAFVTKVRQRQIVDVFMKYFGDQMQENPKDWRTKFRKMSANPFTFYRPVVGAYYFGRRGKIGH